MEKHLYWISAITYAFVLCIILISDTSGNKKPGRLEKCCRAMSYWVVFFCAQDVVWGLCECKVIQSDTVFFISSSVFHLSTVITTFFWLNYVLEYMGDIVKHKRLYLILDGLMILAELVLVIVNIYRTTLFSIENGNYVTGTWRALTFTNQYIVYLIIGLATLILSIRNKTEDKSHYKSVFLFTLAPILLGVCQLLYPEAPFYSLGYFLGCFIIHIFVVAHDREVYMSREAKYMKIVELNKELENKQEEIDDQFEILQSISGVFDYINLIDFKSCTTLLFNADNPVEEMLDIANNPHVSLNIRTALNIEENDYDRFWQYTDLSTLGARMKNRKLLTEEFKCKEGDWLRAMYIRVGDDVNEPLERVVYALRNITKDRKREEQVYTAMANLVYSLHIIDLENDKMEKLIASDIINKIVGDIESGQLMANTIMKATCKEEYVDYMLSFVDLSTVSERMRGKKFISAEFVGKFNGWMRMSFIPIETDGFAVKKIVVSTQIIDSEKNEIINLIYKSSTDELTRLYNRRMYEEELDRITQKDDYDSLIIVAMDVNGLKRANDDLGHKAGDELIIGAADCMNKCFYSVGKVYRTGGDEFMAILRCDEETLKEAISSFNETIKGWSGILIDSLSISYGYVTAKECPGISARELASEADKRMYAAKAEYYKQSGIERRRG